MDRAADLLQNLLRSVADVRIFVVRVGKLLRDKDLGVSLTHAQGGLQTFFDALADVAVVMHKAHFRSVVVHELAPLETHRVRHDDDRFVTLDGADQRKADALVAAGGLHDHGVRAQKPGFLSLLDHVERRAAFDGAAHVQGFHLYQNFGAVGSGQFMETDHRGMPHGLEDVVVNHIPVTSHTSFSKSGNIIADF